MARSQALQVASLAPATRLHPNRFRRSENRAMVAARRIGPADPDMHTLSKSIQRRLHDANFATRYLVGDGIDIGSGADPLDQYIELFPLMVSVRAFDAGDGDAELMTACRDNQFDFVHSSHCLQHMKNPEVALAHWFRILKPGGHLIVVVPDEDMYEQGVFPSTYDNDHKWTFSIYKTLSWSKRSRNVLALLGNLGPAAEVIKVEALTGSYRYRLARMDQTQTPIGESAIEFVVRRRLSAESEGGGLIGPAREEFVKLRSAPNVQYLFNNSRLLRDVVLTATTDANPHTVVMPFATYSPWAGAAEFQSVYRAIYANTLVDQYRCYELWCLVQQVARIPGEILEIGVWRGGTGCLLGRAAAHAKIDCRLLLADTFAGVAKAGEMDAIYRGGEHKDTSVELVKALLDANGVGNYSILKGIFPEESGAAVADCAIRLAHIDVDVYESAKGAFEWVWPRMSPGAVVVFDDYGFFTCPGVTTFVNEQSNRSDAFFFHNLNGHALLVKTRGSA
jgi:O-methyltransferase